MIAHPAHDRRVDEVSERDESQPVGSLILYQTEDGQTHVQCGSRSR